MVARDRRLMRETKNDQKSATCQEAIALPFPALSPATHPETYRHLHLLYVHVGINCCKFLLFAVPLEHILHCCIPVRISNIENQSNVNFQSFRCQESVENGSLQGRLRVKNKRRCTETRFHSSTRFLTNMTLTEECS